MSLGTAVVLESSQFRPQDAGGWKPGLAMAFFIHLFLIGGLALSVNWKIQPPPAAVEAEMWTEVPKIEDVVPPVPVPPQPVVVPPKPVESAQTQGGKRGQEASEEGPQEGAQTQRGFPA